VLLAYYGHVQKKGGGPAGVLLAYDHPRRL
jgi:hypothetical protein